MSKYDEFDDNDSFVSRLGSRFGLRHGAMAVGALVVLGLGYMILSSGDEGGALGNVPVIRADSEPYKVPPEEAGGMPVPNQNSTIFETLKGQDAEKPRVENLLAEEEQPMTKADIAPAETAPAKTDTAGDKKEIAMIDSKAETAKPATTPSEPEGSDVANTEPSATSATDDTEKPMVIGAEKVEEPKKETAMVEPKKPEPEAVEYKAPETKAVATKTTSGSTAIQFAAVKSDAEARQLWSSLQSKNPELQGKTLRVQKADLGAKGVFYRVQVAGLSADSASSVCGAVKSRGGSCMVVK